MKQTSYRRCAPCAVFIISFQGDNRKRQDIYNNEMTCSKITQTENRTLQTKVN